MFNGYMRKVVFPLVAMVAVGWLLIIIGFGIETNQPQVLLPVPVDTRIGASIRYSWWMVIFVTPGMLVMAVIQAAIDSNRLAMNIIGAATTFLSALFLTALGFLLTIYGLTIDLATQVGITIDSASLQFSGAIIAAIFWVALTCVSHFYEREGDLVTG